MPDPEGPGKRVLVTGGAGFIGSHLVDRLVAEGADVVVVDDLSSGAPENLPAGVDLVEGDIRNAAVARVAADTDLVFHLAVRNVRQSINRPIDNFSVNADGTLRVLEAMRHAARGRFVYVSSSEIYGIPPSGVYHEGALPAPTTVYGAGKLAGEHVTLAYRCTYGMDTRVVRPFNNFGPRSHFEGDSGEVIPKFILRALAGRPLLVHGDGRQTRDFLYVEDTARWLPRLAQIEPLTGEVVNIGSGRETAVLELAEMIIAKVGSGSEIRFVEERPGDLPRLVADTRKLNRLTPFSLDTDLESGLDRTIAWFAAQDVERLLELEVDRTWT